MNEEDVRNLDYGFEEPRDKIVRVDIYLDSNGFFLGAKAEKWGVEFHIHQESQTTICDTVKVDENKEK